MKIVFFGTSEFAVPILRKLYGQQIVGEIKVLLVVTAPDKPAGRGKMLTPSLVKQTAQDFNLSILTPDSLKNNKHLIAKIQSLSPDFIVLASYGKIIPKEILDVPKKGAINVHPSLLPKYRGASPIQAAILAGEKSTGVTIIRMNEKMDEGDILASAKLRISAKDSAQSLSNKLAFLATRLILHVLVLVYLGKIKPKPQKHKKATYTKIIRKEDGFVDWKKPPENLDLMIRAYYPWPGVWTYYSPAEALAKAGQVTRIRDQARLPDLSADRQGGQGSGKKILKLLPNRMVQLEGKNPVSLKEFKAGHKDFTLSW
ncbi:MAG: methionyl-tRNA formyltransferase [Candidatus Woykebacteria bacterium RBG_16_43_9]|uniref:Methionyl-tRNA formyltransferase n=1 Tax=Candidatus Woykebacteria bacterium RBG_16_43_9 TaxID=1802596 RepID=A0A1G1WED0_9BACT|nr:MAG: methionyl-tRNA formyltransferase [Candidatus Woykebacteria bacterium RBG_16_43_9]